MGIENSAQTAGLQGMVGLTGFEPAHRDLQSISLLHRPSFEGEGLSRRYVLYQLSYSPERGASGRKGRAGSRLNAVKRQPSAHGSTARQPRTQHRRPACEKGGTDWT